jgi:hypothetical protein
MDVQFDDENLTPEERQALNKAREQREAALAKVNSLASELVKKRDHAVTSRAQSGIEEDWLEDEEFYEGIDDANREFQRQRSTKPLTAEGGTDTKVNADNRSRVFLNITRPYVDAAAAKVADMLLPTDDQNWGIEPTPLPSLVKSSKDKSPLLDPATGQQQIMQAMDEQGNPIQKPMTVADQVDEILNKAKDAAKAAENRIDDWLTESNYNNETRKVIEYAARLGTGIMKGPYPVERRNRAISKGDGGLVEMIEEVTVGPESRAISPWNLYPDPSCGNNVHNGSFIWERDKINARQLKEMRNDKTYIVEYVEQVLREGPAKKFLEEAKIDKGLEDIDDKEMFDIWYYHGFLGREEMESAGCECDEFEQFPAIVTIVNDTVIKVTFNPNSSGEFPYDVMPWQAREDHWAGIGVARQIRTPQRMLNGAARQMMDNAGLSSGPQIVVKRGAVEPENGAWVLEPRKIWIAMEDYEGTVQDAFTSVNINSMQNDLMAILQLAIKIAEDVTGLPMLLQGQQGQAPQTLGGMQMMNNNASTVLRRIARTFDDNITEPHIRRYYDWLLEDPDVPSEEKGDFNIVARGSSALVERDIQNQAVAQMIPLLADPEFRINKAKWFSEHMKSQRLDPRLFQYTDEEFQKMQEAMAQQPPPVDPKIQIEQMRLEAEERKHSLEMGDREAERQFRREMALLERDIAAMRLSSETKVSLDKIKAKLTEVAMVQKNKRDIFAAEAKIKNRHGEGI